MNNGHFIFLEFLCTVHGYQCYGPREVIPGARQGREPGRSGHRLTHWLLTRPEWSSRICVSGCTPKILGTLAPLPPTLGTWLTLFFLIPGMTIPEEDAEVGQGSKYCLVAIGRLQVRGGHGFLRVQSRARDSREQAHSFALSDPHVPSVLWFPVPLGRGEAESGSTQGDVQWSSCRVEGLCPHGSCPMALNAPLSPQDEALTPPASPLPSPSCLIPKPLHAFPADPASTSPPRWAPRAVSAAWCSLHPFFPSQNFSFHF